MDFNEHFEPYTEGPKRPEKLVKEIDATYKKLEKLSRLHLGAWINASMDPSEHNIAQAQKLDKKFEELRERYENLYCKNELIILATKDHRLN
jgi:hypothetical protein